MVGSCNVERFQVTTAREANADCVLKIWKEKVGPGMEIAFYSEKLEQ